MADELPDFVPPMLAKVPDERDRAAILASDRHRFEVKWDGFRALAFVERHRPLRLLSRNRQDLLRRHPELEVLRGLPAGTVLDGEIVAEDGELPAFESVLRRDGVTSFIAFDVLYDGYEEVMAAPLSQRCERVASLCDGLGDSRIVASDGVVGGGEVFFRTVCDHGLEGVIAKRLDSRYLPGRRTDAWFKIKRTESLRCAVVGWLPSEGDGRDLKSLVVATPDAEGRLCVVGRVGSGFSADLRAELVAELRARASEDPLVESREDALWIDPPLFCVVEFVERTRGGMLRAPRFKGLIED